MAFRADDEGRSFRRLDDSIGPFFAMLAEDLFIAVPCTARFAEVRASGRSAGDCHCIMRCLASFSIYLLNRDRSVIWCVAVHDRAAEPVMGLDHLAAHFGRVQVGEALVGASLFSHQAGVGSR